MAGPRVVALRWTVRSPAPRPMHEDTAACDSGQANTLPRPEHDVAGASKRIGKRERLGDDCRYCRDRNGEIVNPGRRKIEIELRSSREVHVHSNRTITRSITLSCAQDNVIDWNVG